MIAHIGVKRVGFSNGGKGKGRVPHWIIVAMGSNIALSATDGRLMSSATWALIDRSWVSWLFSDCGARVSFRARSAHMRDVEPSSRSESRKGCQ